MVQIVLKFFDKVKIVVISAPNRHLRPQPKSSVASSRTTPPASPSCAAAYLCQASSCGYHLSPPSRSSLQPSPPPEQPRMPWSHLPRGSRPAPTPTMCLPLSPPKPRPRALVRYSMRVWHLSAPRVPFSGHHGVRGELLPASVTSSG